MRLIFVSHASADAADARAFRRSWLAERDGDELFLSSDLDAGPQGGMDWRSWIRRTMRSCDLVVFIASPASFSPWCSAELGMARLLDRPILPLTVTPDAPVNPLVGDVQAIPLDQPTWRLVSAADQRLGAPEVVERPGEDVVPYPGLAPFTAEYEVFLGRHDLRRRILEGIDELRTDASGKFAIVSGPSGSGKSSLVRAGLLPALTRRGWDVSDVTQPRTIAETGPPGLPDGAGPRLVVVDQAEELASQNQQQTDNLGSWLTQCSEGDVAVLFVVRSEFRTVLDAYVHQPMDFYVPYVERADLFDVIELPAKYAQLEVPQALVKRLVAETGSGEALPLLAYTLNLLWARRNRATSALDEADLNELGGVQGVLSGQAASALNRATAGLNAAERKERRSQVLAALSRLASTAHSSPTREPLPITSFTTEQRRWLEDFRNRGLLAYRTTFAVDDSIDSGDPPSGTHLVDVTHEALFAWKPLAAAIDRNRDSNASRRAIEDAAAAWKATGEADRTLLLAGPRLAFAREQGMASNDDHIGRFVRASLKQDRDRRVRLVLVGAVGLLAVVSVAAFVVAWNLRNQAEAARVEAQSVRVAAQANDAIDSQRDFAMLAAAEGFELSRNVDTEGALINSLATPGGPLRYFTDDEARWESLRLLSATTGMVITRDRGLALVDLPTRRLTDIPIRIQVSSLHPSASGEVVAVAGTSQNGDKLMHHAGLVRPRTGELLLVEAPVQVEQVAELRGGVIFGDADGGLYHAPLDEGALHGPSLVDRHNATITSVAISPDHRWVVSASPDAIRAHRYLKGYFEEPDLLFSANRRTAETVVFRQQGPVELLAAGSDPLIRRWVVQDGKFRRADPVGRHPGVVEAMATDPTRPVLYTGGLEGTIQVWDLDANVATGGPFRAHRSDVLGLSTTEWPAVLSSDEQTSILWDLAPHRTLSRSEAVPDAWSGRTFAALVQGDGPLAAVTTDGEVLVDAGVTMPSPAGARRAWWAGSQNLVVETGNPSQVDLGPSNLWLVDKTGVQLIAESIDAADVGTCIAAAATGDSITFIDVGACGTVPASFSTGASTAREMALTDDETRLAVIDHNNRLQEYDLPAGVPRRAHEISTPVAATSLAWQDENHLIVGHDRGADVRIISLDEDENQEQELTGHDDAVWWLQTSPQRNRLFSAGQDARIVQSDLTTSRQVGEPLIGIRRSQENDESAAVRGLRLEEDTLFAIHGNDLVAWDLLPDSLLDRACGSANRSLTESEARVLGVSGSPHACNALDES